MRRLNLLAILLFSVLISFAQDEKEVESKIDAVTVFLNGAQVTRTFNQSLASGNNVLKVIGLTPHLDPKTVQVKGDGDFTIVSVKHQMNYIDIKEVQGEMKKVRDSLNYFQRQFTNVQTKIKGLNESEAFLKNNRAVKGNTENLDITNLKGVHQYYYTQLMDIYNKRNDLAYEKAEIIKGLNRYRAQLNSLNRVLSTNTSEVLLEVQTSKATSGKFQMSYLVNHASWYPSYDVRVSEINKPLQLIYKANVRQQTGEDWSNVKLTFSNANPYQSGDIPVLRPYYLNYTSAGYGANPYRNKAQNSYNLNNYISSSNSQAAGRVIDQQGQPVPFATIRVSGTAIGTVTDDAGNFTISLPQGKNQLYVSAVGYGERYQNVAANAANTVTLMNAQAASINKSFGHDLNADFKPDSDGVMQEYDMEETAVSYAYSSASKQLSVSRKAKQKRQAYVSKPITVLPLENQTTIEITLDMPFTIATDGRLKVVSMNQVEVPAYYEYRSVPKLEAAAFLIARVVDWGDYNLLEGEANLYFENTYIGKSILDVRYVTDTLNISLGRDKGVLVSRQKVKSQTTSEFIGSDKIEKRQFEIKVKNGKKQPINLIVYDQVPLTQRPKEIEVDLKEKSGAIHNTTTGELKWKMKLEPSKSKSFSIKYNVKFPKNKYLNLE